MARLQILELPEGTGDDRPPFILVIDQVPTDEAGFDALRRDIGTPDDLVERIGAHAVLVFEDTIDLPANDVPLDENGHPLFLKVHIEGEWEKFRAQAEEEIRSIQRRTAASLGRAAITDHDHRTALTDTLGMDRTGGWDDIRNAAAGLRKERDAQAEAIERVRQESARIRATTRTWEPVADLIDAALNGNQATAVVDKGESTGRPTHPDGTPYRYHEIKDGGWHHCDGCRTWGQWTAEKPHDCINSQTAQTMNPNRDA